MMPGLQPLRGPQGLESIFQVLEGIANGKPYEETSIEQSSITFDGFNNLGITAPTIQSHGIGPLGQVIPKV